MKQLFLWIGLFVFAAISCGKKKPVPFDYGKVVNNVYLNNYFHLKFPIPKGWYVLNKQEQIEMSKAGRDYISRGNSKLKEEMRVSEINTASLLGFFKYKLGTNIEFNSNITVMAENLKNFSEIKDGNDYLLKTKEQLLKMNVQVNQIDSKTEHTKLSGKDFYMMNLILSIYGMDVNQTYYATVSDGFALGIVLSYANDLDKKALENSVRSIVFTE